MPLWANENVLAANVEDLHLTTQEKERLNAALQNISPTVEQKQLIGATFTRLLEPLAGRMAEKFSSGISAAEQAAILKHVLYMDPAAGSYSTHFNGVEEKVCIVALPDDKNSAQDDMAALSPVPEDSLDNIPGTSEEGEVFLLAHEITHCGQKSSMATLKKEKGADEGAIAIYDREIKSGHVKTASVPAVAMKLRAIAAFLNYNVEDAAYSVDHDTSFFVDIDHPGQKYKEKSSLKEKAKAVGYKMTGRSVPDLMTAHISAALFSIHQKACDRLVRDMSVSQQNAATFIEDDPTLYYHTIKALDDEGFFAKSAFEQKVVTQFLSAAITHAPRFFGTEAPIVHSHP